MKLDPFLPTSKVRYSRDGGSKIKVGSGDLLLDHTSEINPDVVDIS